MLLLLLIVITAIATLYSVIRTPSFQELAGRLAADYITKHLGIEIYLDRVRISDLLTLEIHGLKIKDHHHGDLVDIGGLNVRVKQFSLKDKVIRLDYVSLHNAGFYLRKYESDSISNLTTLLKGLKAPSTDSLAAIPSDTIASGPFRIYCEGISLDNVSFGFTDENLPHPGEAMDFTDIQVSDIFLFANDISIIGDSIAANIKHLSCYEKSGFRLNAFKASASVSSTGIRTRDLDVRTGGTHASMDLDFLYANYDKLSDFLDSVYIDAGIKESVLTLADIGYFAPVLNTMIDPIMFHGIVQGRISDFSAKDFSFNLGNYTEFKGDVAMKGLPDFNSTYNRLNIKRLVTTPEDVASFHMPFTPEKIELPEELDKLGMTTIKGTFEGKMLDFKANLDLSTDVGSLTFDGNLKKDPADNQPVYSADIVGQAINLSEITGQPDLGMTDIDIECEGKSFDPKKIKLYLNGWIENFEFRDYAYRKILFGGLLSGYSYDGRLFVLDTNLNLSFTGLVDFNDTIPGFNFDLNLEKAMLSRLHLSDKSTDMNIRTRLKANFKGITPDDFLGNISISHLLYHERKTDYILDTLNLTSSMQPDGSEKTVLISDFVDAEVIGPLVFDHFVGRVIGIAMNQEVMDIKDISEEEKNQVLNFNINFKDLDKVTDIFLPTVQIAPGAKMHGKIDFRNKKMDVQASADSIIVGGIKLDSVTVMAANSASGGVDLKAGIEMIVLKEDEDTVTIGMPNFIMAANARYDSISWHFAWDNGNMVETNNAFFEGNIYMPSVRHIEATIREAHASFYGNTWSLDGVNKLVFDSTYTEISDLRIAGIDQSFQIDGRLSPNLEDTLRLSFSNWHLSNFNTLLVNSSLSVAGIIDGQVGFLMKDSVPDIFTNLSINDFMFNEVSFGDARINSRWIEARQALSLDVNIFSNPSSGQPYKVLGLDGYYYPFDDKRNFDLNLSTQNLNLKIIEPLITSFSSHLGGFATGKLKLDGTVDNPVLTGRMKLQRADIKVDYLNVTYSFANELIFDEDYIHFDRVPIYDPNSNEGFLQGGIHHDHFKKFLLDLTIEPNNFMAMNLNQYQNEVFYGKAFATGTVKISGPFSRILIEVNAKTEKGTDVHIPINYSVDVSQGDFIYFTSLTDTLVGNIHREIQLEGVRLDIRLNITKEANIDISLPGNIGFIKANGSGNLRLGVDPRGYLTLNGSYVIQSGLFLFSLEQLVSRRFEILEGSRISWTGNISDADVNIIARYRQRTSLEGLGSTLIDPQAASQKVNVNTDIRMTGNLFNPDLSFGITFPNMQEGDKQAVYAVLDTTDQGLMNQQAISLLVLNSFSTAGANVGSPVNPASIMSNTLSSMLSQISNDFSIGINYMPGDRVSSDQLEVALSTQLLNDRLLIDGNIDVSSDNSTSQHTSSIVGDVNIEYKLTQDGRFRIKAFNRSNDVSLLNNYAPYTQGVGIFYRRDFNKVNELFTRKKKKSTETK